jgi:hypothetical protein
VVTGFSEILRTSGAIEDKGIYYWQGVQKDKEFYLQAFPRCETFASNTLNHVTFLQVGHSEPEFSQILSIVEITFMSNTSGDKNISPARNM